MTYVATVSQSILAGYEPILIDCDSNFQMDLNKLEDACKTFGGVKILLLPQLYADTANIREVIRLCDKYNLTLLEDSAEAFGCKTMDKHLGTFGLAGSFSFFANKIITCGEGGCIVTDDDILAEKLRLFKNQANIGYYRHDGAGSNFRMTNIQAAIGLAQLEEIDFILEQKALIAAAYRAKISKKVQAVVPQNAKSSEWMPVFKLPYNVNYLDFDRHCKQNDIETRPGFMPVHLMDGFRQLKRTDLSMCESMVDRYFILPCGPTLTNAERNSIIKVVNSYFERK
jgi:perosamine synthetase